MTTSKKESEGKTKTTSKNKYKEYLKNLKLRKSFLLAASGVLAIICLIPIFVFTRKSHTKESLTDNDDQFGSADCEAYDKNNISDKGEDILEAYDKVGNIPRSEILEIFRLRTLSLENYFSSFRSRLDINYLLKNGVYLDGLVRLVSGLMPVEFLLAKEVNQEDSEEEYDAAALRCVNSFGILWPIVFNNDLAKQVSSGGPFNENIIHKVGIKKEDKKPFYALRGKVLNELNECFEDLFEKSSNSAQDITNLLSGKKYFTVTNNEVFPVLLSIAEEVDKKEASSKLGNKMKKMFLKRKEEKPEKISFVDKVKALMKNIASLDAEHMKMHDMNGSLRRAFMLDTDFLNFAAESNKAKLNLDFVTRLLNFKTKEDGTLWSKDYARNLAMLSNAQCVYGVNTELDLSELQDLNDGEDREHDLHNISTNLRNLILEQYNDHYPVGEGCPLIYPLGRSISHEDILKLLWIEIPNKQKEATDKFDNDDKVEYVGKYMKRAQGGYILDRELLKKDFLNHEHIKIIANKSDFVKTLEEAKTVSKNLQEPSYVKAANFSREDFEICASKAIEMQDKLFPPKHYGIHTYPISCAPI